jgi:hypothetical protein
MTTTTTVSNGVTYLHSDDGVFFRRYEDNGQVIYSNIQNPINCELTPEEIGQEFALVLKSFKKDLAGQAVDTFPYERILVRVRNGYVFHYEFLHILVRQRKSKLIMPFWSRCLRRVAKELNVEMGIL